MKTLHNIEKSGFHPGQYVGYGQNTVWRIRRDGHLWRAVANTRPPKTKTLTAKTLQEMSDKLSDKLLGE